MEKRLVFKTIRHIVGREICHYADGNILITSKYRSVFVLRNGLESVIELPDNGYSFPGRFRLFRRVLRLDKCNVLPVGEDLENLVIVRNGKVYYYDGHNKSLTETLSLRNCRTVLHQSICVLDKKTIFLGEYGANISRAEVPVYRSVDGGKSWQIVFRFPAGKIRHVHGCYWDPFEEYLWILTGDFAGECYMLVVDRDFQNTTWLGDGTQMWRACNVFFEKDRVVWIMDSQLEDSHPVILDRVTKQTRKLAPFPGPVWYIKRLDDGYYLAGTACEVGPGVKDEYAHLLVSRDLERWLEVQRYRHDGLPKRYFKFGVIGFSDGLQRSESFYVFGEAIKGLDGQVYECCLREVEALT
ncbi:MAG: hypothetical protein ABFS45_12085 [Pseudomonadota bacterium]